MRSDFGRNTSIRLRSSQNREWEDEGNGQGLYDFYNGRWSVDRTLLTAGWHPAHAVSNALERL